MYFFWEFQICSFRDLCLLCEGFGCVCDVFLTVMEEVVSMKDGRWYG